MQVASQVLFEQMDSRVERPVRIAGVFGCLIIVRQHSQAAHHFTEPLMFVKSEEHTSELQSRGQIVCRLLLGKKKATMPVFAPKGGSGTRSRTSANSVAPTQVRCTSSATAWRSMSASARSRTTPTSEIN